ncbi:MAG TPA: hypothetical protein P5318_14870 [Candidatus Hydrogenedentes bacterium]|nr:hypothetical protein [Candidatus Hydrogenedentota bacterium]HRT21398.1 hypothetical protein [Candidatus Hydrogenedentota bacterium]HRT67025.1 hypothetical protein [Candidatus Hydrogenedentota bacterium]
MNAVIAIALLAGVAAGGIVWFGWAFAQNAVAVQQAKKAPVQAGTPKEPSANKESTSRS